LICTIADLLDTCSSAVGDESGDGKSFRVAAERARTLASSIAGKHGRPTRIAMLLPHSARLAGAAVGTMAGGAAVPLNPRLTRAELEFTMADAAVDALLTDPTESSSAAACAAAQHLGVPVHSLETVTAARTASAPGAEDVALLLHTSGTTARPKLVPLTHRNLLSSASAVAATLALTAGDRGLAVMPMFHIHGIVGSLLSSLHAGADLTVVPFDALRLQSTLARSGATWMSAVPTMYQAVLLRPPIERLTGLRLLRGSSSTMPPAVWRELEDRFTCPVVNSYGMTEAAHQICSTAPKSGLAALGNVGRAAGPEVAMLRAGDVHADGDGEVVVRGPSVTAGYLSPLEANTDAYVGGWFRTGDAGALDASGVLTLRGRLKEIINVGGEKVSPFEVDDVLLAHPAVAEAAAFAAPSRMLGEEVQAVVTLRADADVADLQRHTREHLAKFKVPTRIHVVDAIPKGPTGKVQRLRLAQQLGVDEP
jgi:acyl-CoA synthetase (AMP-forming)/AMP-acid ligase II